MVLKKILAIPCAALPVPCRAVPRHTSLSRLSAALTLFILFTLQGCAIRPRSTPPPTPLTPTAAAGAPSSAASAEPSPVSVRQRKGIHVDAAARIRVPVGDPDGVPLAGRVRATHLCQNGGPISIGFDGSQRGSVKQYGYRQVTGGGNMRYYPPPAPGKDLINVLLFCEDGCSREFVLPVEVLPPTAPFAGAAPLSPPRPPVARDPGSSRSQPHPGAVAIDLEAPAEAGRVCPVDGSTTGLVPGSTIALWVETAGGELWPQAAATLDGDGTFRTTVFLGDLSGAGLNETFRVFAVAPDGTKSNTLTVRRVR